jgi:hypothetical protein
MLASMVLDYPQKNLLKICCSVYSRIATKHMYCEPVNIAVTYLVSNEDIISMIYQLLYGNKTKVREADGTNYGINQPAVSICHRRSNAVLDKTYLPLRDSLNN